MQTGPYTEAAPPVFTHMDVVNGCQLALCFNTFQSHKHNVRLNLIMLLGPGSHAIWKSFGSTVL